jgi:hypothetical protein
VVAWLSGLNVLMSDLGYAKLPHDECILHHVLPYFALVVLGF